VSCFSSDEGEAKESPANSYNIIAGPNGLGTLMSTTQGATGVSRKCWGLDIQGPKAKGQVGFHISGNEDGKGGCYLGANTQGKHNLFGEVKTTKNKR